jgi:hypothetical protein
MAATGADPGGARENLSSDAGMVARTRNLVVMARPDGVNVLNLNLTGTAVSLNSVSNE